MKKIMKIAVMIGLLVIGGAGVYAMTRYYLAKSVTSKFTKKHIFTFDLSTELTPEEIGPGDSFRVNPTVYNDATEEMYVFLSLDMPLVSEIALYSYEINDDSWIMVEEAGGTVVYAYASNETMTPLPSGDTTTVLTDQMSMIDIRNAEYGAIDDINFTITGYGIGTEEVTTDPNEAWVYCKEIGELRQSS